MAYIGCALFGLFFLVMTAQSNGSLHDHMTQTLSWINGWAPFSYIIIVLMLVSGVIAMRTMLTWPEQEQPEDPMAQLRHETAGVPED